MNRRSFFKKLGVGAATIALAPTVLEKVIEPEVVNATLGEYITHYSYSSPDIAAALAQYSDYANFSDMLVDSPVDAEIIEAAQALGDAHAERIRRLTTFNYNVHQVDYRA